MKLIHKNFETVSIDVLKDVAKQAGSCWFGKGTMKFFKSKLPRTVMFYSNDRDGLSGRYFFISSEQCGDQARKYTVRYMLIRAIDQQPSVTRYEMDSIKISEFQEFDTKAEAKKTLIEYINSQPRMDSL